MSSGAASSELSITSVRTFFISSLFYCAILLACGAGVAATILTAPLPQPPAMGVVRGRSIRLGEFQIPRYTKDEQLQLLISGVSSLYAGNRSFSVAEPSILYLSGGVDGKDRIRFTARSGRIEENSSDALLEGGVIITGMTKLDDKWVEKWRVSGDKLVICATAGTFELLGDVGFVSETCNLTGRDLSGAINQDNASLSSFSLASISRCVFAPQTEGKR